MAVSPAASSAGLPASVVFPAGAEAFRQRIRGFIAGSVIPVEQEAFVSGVDDALRIRLQDAARAAGVLAPQAPARRPPRYAGSSARCCCPGPLAGLLPARKPAIAVSNSGVVRAVK